MKFLKTTLPWNDLPAYSTPNLYPYLSERLPTSLNCYLPTSITLYFDFEVSFTAITSFLDQISDFLLKELKLRQNRRDRFIQLRLFSETEIDLILTARRSLQPWILYYSKCGGINSSVQNYEEINADGGVVPCWTMKNHGVAWRRDSKGKIQIWLVTARKEGQAWDMDADIGHESAHSAFAQIPLFAQAIQPNGEVLSLATALKASSMEQGHFSRITYMFSEVAVVAMRGEERDTESGFPVAEKSEEVHAFLKLSNELMPSFGFDRALAAYQKVDGVLDVNTGDEIFEIGAPAMRVVSQNSQIINAFEVPTISWYSSMKSI